jgi:NAD-dependent deacetylase
MSLDARTDIELFRSWVDEASEDSIVFFGGAGVSTASGIPDFRSADGIFTKFGHLTPERIVSYSYFKKHPEDFYDFYRSKMIFLDAEPNAAHRKLAELEQAGRLAAVITQNVDGLHQRAGSSRVLELHGSIHRNYCCKCKRPYDLDFVLQANGVPACEVCGGVVRPDVVLYEESLDEALLEESARAIARASMLIIAGTSLVVFPAAGLVRYFNGDHLVIVNRTPTPQDSFADLCLHDNIAEVFSW